MRALTVYLVGIPTNMEPTDRVRSAPTAMAETSFLSIVASLSSLLRDIDQAQLPQDHGRSCTARA